MIEGGSVAIVPPDPVVGGSFNQIQAVEQRYLLLAHAYLVQFMLETGHQQHLLAGLLAMQRLSRLPYLHHPPILLYALHDVLLLAQHLHLEVIDQVDDVFPQSIVLDLRQVVPLGFAVRVALAEVVALALLFCDLLHLLLLLSFAHVADRVQVLYASALDD